MNRFGARVEALFTNRAEQSEQSHYSFETSLDKNWSLVERKLTVTHTVTKIHIAEIAEKLGLEDFDDWELSWKGQGRGSMSKKDWQRLLLRKLQAVIFLNLANTDSNQAYANVTGGEQNECFGVARLLLEGDAICKSLSRPKNFDLSLVALRCTLGNMALIDLAYDNKDNNFHFGKPDKKNDDYETCRSVNWPEAVKEVEAAVKGNGLLKQDASVSTATLNFYLSTLKLACIALPVKAEASRALKAAFNVVKGVVNLVSFFFFTSLMLLKHDSGYDEVIEANSFQLISILFSLYLC